MVANISEFDIVIVGGGVVGLTAAAALAKLQYRIALIDQGPRPCWQPTNSYGLRVSAMNLASQQLLADVGAWQHIQSRREFPYTAMHVWEQQGDACIDFNSNETVHSSLGSIIENEVMLSALHDVLQEQDNVYYLAQTGLENISAVGDTSMLAELNNGERLGAGLVIGADGQRSKVRACCGISCEERPYHQAGVVCNVQCELPHQNTAWQCFSPQGPLALLPLAEHTCSVVWSLQEAHSAEVLALGEEEFNQQLTQAFENRLGKLGLISERKSFGLRGAQAQQYIDHRIVLMGDAAHSIHPLAGLGLNMGLEDVRCLYALLSASNRPLGSKRVLRQYERERRSRNLLMQRSLEAIDELFRNQRPGAKQLRTAGVNIANKLPPLKLLFMQRALGVPA